MCVWRGNVMHAGEEREKNRAGQALGQTDSRSCVTACGTCVKPAEGANSQPSPELACGYRRNWN